jgi:hypothetical protein
VSRLGARIALVTLLCLLVPATASAKSAKQPKKKLPPAVAAVINDCLVHNGQLTHHYSAALLQEALADLPTDIAEYTTCADALRQAELADIATPRALPNASGGATDANSKLSQAEQAGKAGDLNGQQVPVGAVVLHGSSLLGALPTPVLLVLAALLAIAAVPLAHATRRLVRARRAR